MVFIRAVATDLDGKQRLVQHEGPKDDAGRSPVGFLKPSGKTYRNPLYAFAKDVAGLPDERIRPAHLGLDGHGNEGVSDQRWIYDLDEAARLAKELPDRFVQVES